MIRIHGVKLHNFMSVRDAALDFGEGKATLIVGENGSGKSTVLCAIGLAFDSYKKGSVYSDYITKGETEAQVLIEASVHGVPLTCDITIKQTGTALNRKYTYGDEDPCVNSECDELLKRLDVEYFSKIIFMMQDEGDITKIGASARANLLSKLLNFDFSAQVKELSDQIKELDAKVTENSAGIKLNNELAEEKRGKFETVPAAPMTAEEVKSLETRLAEISDAVAEYDRKTEENVAITAKMDTVRQEIARLDETSAPITERVQRVASEILSKTKDVESFEEKKATLATAAEQAGKEAQALSQNEKPLLEAFEKADEEYNAGKAAVAAKNKEITANLVATSQAKTETATDKKNLAFMEQGNCPTCGSEIDQSAVPALKKKIETASGAIADLVALDARLAKDLAALEAAETSLMQARSTALSAMTSNASNASSAKDRKNAADASLAALKAPDAAAIEALRKSALADEFDLAAIKVKREEETAKLAELDAQRHPLNRSDKVTWKTQEAEIRAKIANYTEWLSKSVEVAKTNKRLEEEIASCEAKAKSLTELNVSHQVEKEDLTKAKQLLDKDFPQFLVVKTCDKLEARINQFVRSVFPDMTIKMYQDKKGVDFFYVPTSSYEANPEDKSSWINISMSSGMERAALSVGWRVALAESYGLDLLMLDECDQAASDRSSEKLLTAVLDSPKFSQVFIITHKKDTRDAIMSSKDITVYYASKGAFYDYDPDPDD